MGRNHCSCPDCVPVVESTRYDNSSGRHAQEQYHQGPELAAYEAQGGGYLHHLHHLHHHHHHHRHYRDGSQDDTQGGGGGGGEGPQFSVDEAATLTGGGMGAAHNQSTVSSNGEGDSFSSSFSSSSSSSTTSSTTSSMSNLYAETARALCSQNQKTSSSSSSSSSSSHRSASSPLLLARTSNGGMKYISPRLLNQQDGYIGYGAMKKRPKFVDTATNLTTEFSS